MVAAYFIYFLYFCSFLFVFLCKCFGNVIFKYLNPLQKLLTISLQTTTSAAVVGYGKQRCTETFPLEGGSGVTETLGP